MSLVPFSQTCARVRPRPWFTAATPWLVAAVLWVAGSPVASAQLKYQIGGALGAAVPIGEFAKYGPGPGLALDFFGLVRLGPLPVSMGAEVGGALFLPFSTHEAISGYPDVFAEAESEPRMLLAHLLARTQWPSGKVRPFLEGRFGLKGFLTETEVNIVNDRTGEQFPVGYVDGPNDTRLSYGFALGVDIDVFGATTGTADVSSGGAQTTSLPGRGYLSILVSYLRGDSVGYLQADSARLVGGEFVVDQVETRTDLLLIQVGVTFSGNDR